MKNTEPHQKCSSSQPPVIGPAATATPLTALQMPIALARSPGSRNMLVMIASVAGKISAAPTPISARPTIKRSADESAAPGEGRGGAEHDQPDDQRPLAAVLVAEPAGGEEQAGEHEQVGVDDPLQLAGRWRRARATARAGRR